MLIVIKGSIRVQLKDVLPAAATDNSLEPDRISGLTTFRSQPGSRLQSLNDYDTESIVNQTYSDRLVVVKAGNYIDKRLFKSQSQNKDESNLIQSSWNEFASHF